MRAGRHPEMSACGFWVRSTERVWTETRLCWSESGQYRRFNCWRFDCRRFNCWRFDCWWFDCWRQALRYVRYGFVGTGYQQSGLKCFFERAERCSAIATVGRENEVAVEYFPIDFVVSVGQHKFGMIEGGLLEADAWAVRCLRNSTTFAISAGLPWRSGMPLTSDSRSSMLACLKSAPRV
jgi:hypothetical protein